MKYIVKINGLYVERFFKNSVLLTPNTENARKYEKAIALKRLQKSKINNYELCQFYK